MYKGYKIPTTLNREEVTKFLKKEQCKVSSEGGCNTLCRHCILATLGRETGAFEDKYLIVIEYAITKGWLTKREAFKYMMDKMLK